MGLEKIKKVRKRRIRKIHALKDMKASELSAAQKHKISMQIAEHFGLIAENDL